jgi:integrase
MASNDGARRGWRERLEPGIYRSHRLSCDSSADHREGRRCGCPLQVVLATGARRSAWTTVDGLPEARRARACAVADVGSNPIGLIVALPVTLGAFAAEETLRTILRTAVAYGKIPTNAADGLRFPKRSAIDVESVRRVLNEQGVRLMLDAAGSLRNETMLRAAVETGMRKGEIIALRWSDVDLEARRIRVARSAYQDAAGRIEHAPKSGRARMIAIGDRLASDLARLYEANVIGSGDNAAGYVWPGLAGNAMGRSTPSQLLARVLRRAGLERACSFHGLRHTAASRAFAAGVPLIVISRQLGHASSVVTAKVYAHLLEESQLDAFAAAMAPAPLRDALREDAAAVDAA